MSVYDRIMIAGGGGMLAYALKGELTRRKLAYVEFDLDSCDITDSAQVANIFRAHRPTLVLNCAAFTAVDKCEEVPDLANAVNGLAVANLARHCGEYGAKLVHISTDFVFDGRSSRPYRPDDPTNPLSAYGRSKLLGEQFVREINPPGWIMARTAWLYGPKGNCFPKTMIGAARAGKPLRVVSDQIGAPTYTRDLAVAAINLLDAGAAGIFHLTNSGQTNWFDFTRAILEEFQLSADLQAISSADWQKLRPQSAIRPGYSVLDTSDYSRATGKKLPEWREALRRYHEAGA